MVGGIVIGLARGVEDTLLHVQDTHAGYESGRCSVRTVERRIDTGEAIVICLGDSIWWQSGRCYWTPKATKDARINPGVGCGKEWDIALPKVGYSH